MPLSHAVPALPVVDVAGASRFYQERLGFAVRYAVDAFAIMVRDGCELHLWQADDASWRARSNLSERPVRSGAESFLAGTASCRVAVVGPEGTAGSAEIEDLYAEIAAAGVLHPVSRSGVEDTDHGTREVNVLDQDGNLLTFYAEA